MSQSNTEAGDGEVGDAGLAGSLKLEIGQQVVYTNGQVSDMARIKSCDNNTDRRKSLFNIEFPNGTILEQVHRETLSLPKKVDPTVDKVLSILNLREQTDKHFRAQYPSLKVFEEFFLNTTDEFKAKHKRNSESYEPLFKRSDLEELIILCRWIERNQSGGKIDWEQFNKESFNDFRKRAPKEDLEEVLKELGMYNDKVVSTLEEKNVQTPDHFVQKSKSWFEKLPGMEENSNHLLLSGSEKHGIEKFRDWYSFHFIGYLPSDWIVSFRNDDVHPKERELHRVLGLVGLNADAIRALKMNGIRDVIALNRRSKDWRTETKRGLSVVTSSVTDRMPLRDVERDHRANEWKRMGLTRNDASDIITFRHWYNFYVAGRKHMKGWSEQFTSAHFRNFIQRYEPGDSFKRPNILSPTYLFSHGDKLRLSQEKQDYYDMLQRAAEIGDVTEEQRFHLLQYMKKREKLSLIEEITSDHDEGVTENVDKEERLRELLQCDEEDADEKVKEDLLFSQVFCQFFFSALLVMVLLVTWTGTTAIMMKDSILDGKDHNNEYLTFIHNVVFGLVSAVVIQELGEEAKETSLYHRFLDTYREQVRRSKEYRFLNDVYLTGCRGKVKSYWYRLLEWGKTTVMGIILWSTRLYIIFWIVLGVVSLGFGAIQNLDTSNALYTTGQTWLGIAVTIGYAYFGLSSKNTPKAETVTNENGQQSSVVGANTTSSGTKVHVQEEETKEEEGMSHSEG